MKNQKNNSNQLGNSYFKVQEQLGIVRRELKIANERLAHLDAERGAFFDANVKLRGELAVKDRKLKSVRRDLWLSLATVVLITLVIISGVAL